MIGPYYIALTLGYAAVAGWVDALSDETTGYTTTGPSRVAIAVLLTVAILGAVWSGWQAVRCFMRD